MASLPKHDEIFTVQFENGHTAQAVRVRHDADSQAVLRTLGFAGHSPVIFISGGAGAMSDEDKRLTRNIIQGLVAFADEHNIVVIDGGTESGIMKMIGDTRHELGLTFPLIGVSPLGRVAWPGYDNPQQQAFLEDNHSHFVIVDGEEWGAESTMIVRLTYALAGPDKPSVGVLINGGKIAMQEVYLATSTHRKMPIIVLEGSGRAADEISTAFRTGKSTQRVLKAILSGGDIQLVGTVEGPPAMRKKLEAKFVKG
jgi:hypothetical protein